MKATKNITPDTSSHIKNLDKYAKVEKELHFQECMLLTIFISGPL